jgi:hypothetical protein
MSPTRRLEALQRLAERPGTTHEGEVARQKLAALKAKGVQIETHTRVLYQGVPYDLPNFWDCPCGNRIRVREKCGDRQKHESIRAEMMRKFPKGTRVYYNRWCYGFNETGIVMGYPKPDSENWHWIRIRFDRMKQSRNVPAYSEKGCHLSTEPVSREEHDRLYRP